MYTIREALAAIRRAPVLTGLSAAMVALALFVVGLFAVATYNLHQALSRVEERVEVVIYVQDDVREAELRLLEEDMLGLPEVQGVRHVSKEEALVRARTDLPEFEDLFLSMDVNPLPASLEVELAPGFRDPASVERVADRTAIYPFVEEVRFGREWIDRLHLLRQIGGIATGILGTAFAVVAGLIIATAVRIAIFARRDEIQIMRLVGATNGFIRRPFLLEGALTGVLGGFLALILTYLATVAVSRTIFPLEWIPTEWIVGGVTAGGLFGLVASAFAIRRYLREV